MLICMISFPVVYPPHMDIHAYTRACAHIQTHYHADEITCRCVYTHLRNISRANNTLNTCAQIAHNCFLSVPRDTMTAYVSGSYVPLFNDDGLETYFDQSLQQAGASCKILYCARFDSTDIVMATIIVAYYS